MKPQLSKYDVTRSFDLRIALLCIIVLISSNGFSQNHFVKRKYMKGFFTEKNTAKNNNKGGRYSTQKLFSKKIGFIQTDTVVAISKSKVTPELSKEDAFKNLVILETPVKKNVEAIKSEVSPVSVKSLSSNHNNIDIIPDFYCSISKSKLLTKKSFDLSNYSHSNDKKQKLISNNRDIPFIAAYDNYSGTSIMVLLVIFGVGFILLALYVPLGIKLGLTLFGIGLLCLLFAYLLSRL